MDDRPDIPQPDPPHEGLLDTGPKIPYPQSIPGDIDPIADRVFVKMRLLEPPKTLIGRIRMIWDVLTPVVEEVLQAAETILGPGTGKQKKDYAVKAVMGLIEEMEDKFDFIPGWIQGPVFGALRFGVGFMIERVLGSLKRSGAIPS